MTKDQESCIETLSEWVCGRHHLPKVKEFGTGVCINYSGDLSTFDFDRLTRLVLLAHRDAVRIEIASSGPRLVRIIAHKRRHGDRNEMKMHEWHPSLSDLAARIDAAMSNTGFTVPKPSAGSDTVQRRGSAPDAGEMRE